MYKKLQAIFILLLFLFSTISVASAIDIMKKEDINQSSIDFNEEFIFDPANKIVTNCHEYKKEATEDDGFTFFDIQIYASCWWSPIIWWESEDGLKCYNVFVDFKGISRESGLVTINMYWIFPGKEVLFKTEYWQYQLPLAWDCFRFEGYESTDNKPVGIRAEVITDLDEITKNNNEVSSEILDGITIDGYAYKKNSDGKKIPLMSKEVSVFAHLSHYDKMYYHTFTQPEFSIGDVKWWDDGYYCLVAPIKPGNPPCRYMIKTNYNSSEYQIKTTCPLNIFENTTMPDFVFSFSKAKSCSMLKILGNCNFLEKILELVPFFKKFSNKISSVFSIAVP